MKKYIKPSVKLIQIETKSMIAASLGFDETPATGDAGARPHANSSDWDEY